MSRTTDDPKMNIVRVRLTREEIMWLYRERSNSGRTISEIIRECIDRVANNKDL